ncbi:MAG: 3'(2'),5'-bisphosphate nucleotidase CysQ [Alphaproteobacteria bacterium]|nr:3'(2'),5'-bisphosphate nucleotidase CysQ [Alphaproteobacteria bacterium]
MLLYPAALCNQLKLIAARAGEITLEYFDESGYKGVDAKADGSPVTLADQKAEEFIIAELKKIAPSVPFIGEESVEAGKIPSLENQEYFWLVDPLDGTKEFISGSGDYTVNIALMQNLQPVTGVVYAPYLGSMYAGHGPGTATCYLEETESEKSISVRPPPKEGLSVVASRSHGAMDEQEKFLEQFKIAKIVKRGSSLKFCAIAAGKADIYPRFGPTCEWDTAAAHAVLRSAGGDIVNLDGTPFVYGKCGKRFLNPSFIAHGGWYQ